MRKALIITICGFLILALALPASANGSRSKRSDASFAARVYSGGSGVADQAAGLCTGCLKRTFSLFNPCLDFVKGCTSLVLTPIEKPFEYMEKAIEKQWPGRKSAKASATKKR